MDKGFIERFNSTYKEYFNSVCNIREVCIDMLKEVCNRTESKEVSLVKLKKWAYDHGEGYPTVSYDGGDHPECASNCYSTVDCIKLKNGNIFFDIEETSDYHEDRVMTIELISICDYIIIYENAGFKLGVDEYEN